MKKYFGTLVVGILAFLPQLSMSELYVGCRTVDLTPPRAVALDGQMGTRISTEVLTPMTANIISLESREGEKMLDACVFVSFDLVGIRPELDSAIREEFATLLPEYDPQRLILCATHTHTAPVADKNKYHIPESADCMHPEEYVLWAAQKTAPAIVEAIRSAVPAQYSYGMDFAVVAQCRRAVYENGTAVMYGNTNQKTFRAIEAMEDHDVNTLFFWDKSDKLLAMFVNVSCPAQEVEGLSQLHADFWHPTRRMLKKRLGEEVVVAAICGAAGDVSPHTLYRKEAEARMTRLRKMSRLDEIGRRISNAVFNTYDLAFQSKRSNPVLKHEYRVLEIPQHRITKSEYEQSKAEAEALQKQLAKDPNKTRLFTWANTIVKRYEKQQNDPNATFSIPIHVVRLGDTVFATNPFELFTAYGVQMKARSRATQTFVVQLTDGCGICGTASSAGYLPTEDAYRGGGYSAIVKSITVGPAGGQKLVEELLRIMNGMFE